MGSVNILANLISQRISPLSVEDSQWGEIVSAAVRHNLGPMLYWVLKEELLNLKSDPCFIPLKQSANETAAKLSLFDLARVQIDSAMTNAGIPTIWLKGIALAHTIYPHPWLRPMVDLDVLVPFHQRKLALNAAESIGFKTPEEPDVMDLDIFPEELKHHFMLIGGPADSVFVELHYKLLVSEGEELLSFDQLDWFWYNTCTVIVERNKFYIFNSEANILFLCAHALLQHGAANTTLVRIFDLHLLITRSDPDWQRIVEKALDLMWSYPVERALNLAINFFETPVPPWVLDQLGTRRSPKEDTFQVTRFQGKGHRLERRMLELSNLSFPARLRVILKRLFPSKDFLQKRYTIPPGHPVLPYYFYRWFDASRQLFWAIRSRLANFFHRN